MEVQNMKTNPCTRMMACAVIVGILVVVLSGCPDSIEDDPTVTAVTVSPATVSVPKGGTQSFSATVRGTGNPAQTVTWTLSGREMVQAASGSVTIIGHAAYNASDGTGMNSALVRVCP
jgi:hypothetical protein